MGILNWFKKKSLFEENMEFAVSLKKGEFKSMRLIDLIHRIIERIREIDEHLKQYIDLTAIHEESPDNEAARLELEKFGKKIGDVKKLVILRNALVKIVKRLNQNLQKRVIEVQKKGKEELRLEREKIRKLRINFK